MAKEGGAWIGGDFAMQDRRREAHAIEGNAVAGLGGFLAGAAVEVFPDELWDAPFGAGAHVVKAGEFGVRVHWVSPARQGRADR